MDHSSTDGTPAITQAVHAHGYTVPVPDLPISPEQLSALEELKFVKLILTRINLTN